MPAYKGDTRPALFLGDLLQGVRSVGLVLLGLHAHGAMACNFKPLSRIMAIRFL